ncbi:hypothetical protein [Capnocytophaga stomatis]|uniref:hypothetical protein n=1 Tax=Capnocytophaga stomatis TaxID=1848904 RepID=UPI002100983D|nr:hypothetical protein [Capnocytophaga stomatis]
MENKSTYYQGYDFSPLEVFEWIKHGALEHINAKKCSENQILRSLQLLLKSNFQTITIR